MKIPTFSFLTFLFTAISAYSQIPQFQWVKQIGNGYIENTSTMSTDDQGNIYTSGNFSGTVDFDPGSGTYNLESTTKSYTYLTKIDAQGNFVWARTCGSSAYPAPIVTFDNASNTYVTGDFKDSVEFETENGKVTMKGNSYSDVYIAKYSSEGKIAWIKTISGQSQAYNHFGSITTDDSGHIYVIGTFRGTTDFDPGAGSFNLSTKSTSTYIVKLDSSSNFIWAKQFNSIDDDALVFGTCIKVDKSGNVYTSGAFSQSIDFDPGIDTVIRESKPNEQLKFICKLDKDGNYMWLKNYKVYSVNDKGNNLTTDNFGNVYAFGEFGGAVNFDTDSPSGFLYSTGQNDVFIVKFDSSGMLHWAKSMGGGGADYGISIAVDHVGNVYSVGLFSGIADFDPGKTMNLLTSVSNSDIFISKLDVQGNYVWAKQLGSSQKVFINLDYSGTIYIAGDLKGISDFDPGSGILFLSSNGDSDIFIEKIKEVPLTISEQLMLIPCSISPNPSSNSMTVNFGRHITNGRIKLINLIGQTVLEQSDVKGTSLSIDIANQPMGMYFLEMSEAGSIQRMKVVKE